MNEYNSILYGTEKIITKLRYQKTVLSNKFRLPKIDDIPDQLGRAFLMSVFYQVELISKYVTSLSKSNGFYRFTRLPYITE